MRGHNPDWDKLPRRKCDDCGKSYKPKQPLKKDQRGFCSDNCRKSYHKHGGAYRKLRGEMFKLVAKELKAIEACLTASLFEAVAKAIQPPAAPAVEQVTSQIPQAKASSHSSR
jgi:hypothetical protein